jgi:hypothetical protein
MMNKTGALCPVAGALPGLGFFAQTAYKEPISCRQLDEKTPVAAKKYFSKNIPGMSSIFSSLQQVFSPRLATDSCIMVK